MVWLSIENTIRQNLTDMQFCVSRLALLLDISPSYLREIVHRHFKTTPQKLIQKHRIEYAVLLLTNSEKVQKVSRTVGYGTSRAFRNAFYKELGLTPREFKRQIRRGAMKQAEDLESAAQKKGQQDGLHTKKLDKKGKQPMTKDLLDYEAHKTRAGRAAEDISKDLGTELLLESGDNFRQGGNGC